MNKNQGLFWIDLFARRLTGVPNIELQYDIDTIYEIKATEITTGCTAYIFAPEHAGEKWEVIMTSCNGGTVSDWFKCEINCWAERLMTGLMMYQDNWIPDIKINEKGA